MKKNISIFIIFSLFFLGVVTISNAYTISGENTEESIKLAKAKTSSFSKTPTTKNNTQEKSNSKTSDANITEKKSGGFLGGMLGGVLTGTLLGSILGSAFGGGLGTFLMVIIVAILAFFLWKMFKKKREMKMEQEIKRRMEEKGQYTDI